MGTKLKDLSQHELGLRETTLYHELIEEWYRVNFPKYSDTDCHGHALEKQKTDQKIFPERNFDRGRNGDLRSITQMYYCNTKLTGDKGSYKVTIWFTPADKTSKIPVTGDIDSVTIEDPNAPKQNK